VYVTAKVKVKFCIVQVDYITLLCQETTDDTLNLKCKACVLSVTIYKNDQQDATVSDNLLFLGCCTCFE
jgi:hypothetical protein